MPRRFWRSPVNWWEVQVRMRARHGEAGVAAAAKWIAHMGIVVESISASHAELALQAHASYQGRPARLNMGDCFAYALARARDVPLLYKGGDFSATDLRSA
jgi:ribonuclease VapC